MQFDIFVASRIDEPLDNKLTDFGNSHDWEKSKSIRNILKTFLSLPRKKQLQLLNSCQED